MDAKQTPPAPDDPEWDDWAEEQLGDVEFDTELGREMAADALRIADGELSKAEFHAKHSDSVESEFGVDERPTKEAFQNHNGPLPSIPDPNKQTRRNVLRALGGVAAAGTASFAGCISSTSSTGSGQAAESAANVSNETDDDGIIDEIDHQKQVGMVIDTQECIACLECSKACKQENNTDTGVHWPYVFRYEDEHAGGTREGYLTRHCQHCSEPSCTWVCPTQARHQRTEDGLVLTDYDTCVGCKYCQVACPYGVNYLGKDEPNDAVTDGFFGREIEETEDEENGIQLGSEDGIQLDSDRKVEYDRETKDGVHGAGAPPKGVMGKCTFCVHRQDSDDPELQGTTACAESCPEDVIHFGDMNDPSSEPRQYLEEHEDSNQYKLLPEVGNEPNIVYLGQEPSNDAEPIQGPVAYEDKHMKDGAYDYVLGPEKDGDGGESQ